MRRLKKIHVRLLPLFILIVTCIFFTCKQQPSSNLNNLQIAFLADVHLQDVFGEFEDNDFKGVKIPNTNKHAIIRTMQSQLNSTRIFNENYFAFIAALDDIVQRKIKYVILPGDFSDDGQPVNIRGLKKILDTYTNTYGVHFFLTTGNHDPVKPYMQDAGKNDFLGKGGKAQPIMSKAQMYVPNPGFEHQVIITKDIQNLGYETILAQLSDFGFLPKKEYLYWETPFSTYNYSTYNYKEALNTADFKNRGYQHNLEKLTVPDVSYLAEPIEGLWLLAIDANTYIPKKDYNGNSQDSSNYQGASVGYNNILSHKKHLITWIEKVAKEAKRLNKQLIAFSHYPMVDFNDDASLDIKNLMGEGKMQLHRVPKKVIAEIFADAGIQYHFGGHMHINDTGIHKTEKGNTLVNIQVPSLAAYIPAYKLLTIKNNDLLDIETIVINNVPNFDTFFKCYEQEYDFLKAHGEKPTWNKDVLSSKSYYEFTNWHLKELTRMRFLPNDWPNDLREILLNCSGKELLILSQIENPKLLETILDNNNQTFKDSKPWLKATKKAHKKLNENVFEIDDLNGWNGFDLVFDFYRLRSADLLAVKDIGEQRLKQYNVVLGAFLERPTPNSEDHNIISDFQNFARIFQKFLNGAPAGHFQLDLNHGTIK